MTSPIRCATVGLIALAPLLTCGTAQAEAADAPLRIVRAGLPDLPGLRRFIDISYEGCLASKGRPPAPAPALPEAALARLAVLEEEELFDGRRWAKYQVLRAVGADPAANCRIMVFHSRSVDIETTCESMLRGTGATLSELMDLDGNPVPPPVIDEGKVRQSECDEPRRAQDTRGLRAEDAGHGAQCVWNWDLVARNIGAGAAGGDRGSYDMCLYSKRPFHYVQGHGRPVVLKTRSDDRSLTGAYIPTFAGQIAGYGNVGLVSLSEGAPIPADRFSRASAEAFLRQPTKTPLGDR